MMRFLAVVLLCLPFCPAQADLGDELETARDAFRKKDEVTLQRQVNRFSGNALEAYPQYWLTLLQIQDRRDDGVRFFLQRFPGSYLADRLQADWVRELGKRQDWAQFDLEWAKLSAAEPESDLNCYRLQSRLASHDINALRTARSLWLSDKSLPEPCNPVFDAMFDNGLLSEADIWNRLRMALEANSIDLATALTRRLPSNAGITDRMIRQVADNPSKQWNRFNLQSKGGIELTLYALQRLARSNPDDGARNLESIDQHLKDEDRRYTWGRIAFEAARKQNPRSLTWFDRAGDAALDVEAREWQVRAALRAGNWSKVLRAIQSLPLSQQDTPTWQYWKGRALRALNRPVEANQLFAALSTQHQFYGLLAREELGTYADTSAGRYKVSKEDIAPLRRDPSISRALALNEIGWRTEATREWNWSVRKLDDRQLLAAAELAMESRWYDRAIYSAERTREVHDFSLRYISPYRDVVDYYAKSTGLDPAWVFGLMRQESRFVTVARSGVGASGLMQLMPGTALWVAKKMGIKNLTPSAVNEVGTNVQLGTFYLKTVLDSLGNQPVLATAAYNAGPGRARAWQGSQPIEGAIYAESIPFSETRDYVKKVMANAYYYSQAFGQYGLTLKQRLGTISGRSGAEPIDDTP